ncbi:MAG: hypothetical protein SGJ11_10750 [Phycisphaerae bacterium]|nr:hypothetical protein [Phycisphaerae bacterium]
MSTPEKKPRRIVLRTLLVLAVLLIVVIALAPTVLSMGLVKGIARDAISERVNGDVQLRGVRLGWFSGQTVEGLAIRDNDGANTVDIDMTLDQGLLALLTSGGSTIDATMTGAVLSTIEADGSLGVMKLAKPSADSANDGDGSQGTTGLPSGLKVIVDIASLEVAFNDIKSKRTYSLDKLAGTAVIDGDSGTVTANLSSPTNFLGHKGTLSLDLNAGNLQGPTLDLAQVNVDAAIHGKNLRVPAGGDSTADFSVASLTIKSPGLGQTLALDATVEGTVDGATASTLLANLVIDKPVKQGAFDVGAANVQGTVNASNLPTALAQPFLGATKFVLSEDIGATIESLRVHAPGGGEAPITLELKAPKAQFAATARVSPSGSVNEGKIDGVIDISKATIERVAGVSVSNDASFAISGDQLVWATPPEGASALSTLVGTIALEPRSAVSYQDAVKKFAVALGPGGRVTLGRPNVDQPFAAQAQLSVGFGGTDALAVAPAQPNLIASAIVPAALDRVQDATLQFDAMLEPAFLTAVSAQSFSKALPVTVTVHDLDAALPLKGANGLSISAEMRITGQSGVYVPQLNRDVTFGDVVATIAAQDASKEAQLKLTGRLDQASIDVQQTLRNLPSDFANIEPLALDTRGTVSVSGLDGASLTPWIPAQHRAMLDAANVRGLAVSLKNEPLAGRTGQRIAVDLGGEPVRGTVVAGVEPRQATIEKLDLNGTLSRALIASLQGDRASKVKLAKDVPFSLALSNAATIKFDEMKEGKLPAGLAARLKVPEVVVSEAPGLSSALVIQNFDATIAVDASANAAKAQGSFAATGTTDPQHEIEGATFDLAWTKVTGPSLLQGLSGDVKLAGVSMPWIELLTAQAPGRFSMWTGDAGGLAVTLGSSPQGETIRLVPTFPRITGTVDVLAKGEAVSAKATDVAVRVPAATLEQMVTKPGMAADATRYNFQGDLVAQLSSASVTLPKGLTETGSKIAGATLDVALETQPLGVRVVAAGVAPEKLDVPAIIATLSSKDFGQGITLTAKDRGAAPGATGPTPSIVIDGTIRQLVDAAGVVTSDKATVDLDATVRAFPTVFIDLLAATPGTLTRSLGDKVDLTAKAQGASKEGGTMSVALKAPFADFNAPSVVVKDGVATVVPSAPITASFTMSPGIKEDLLYVINPIFADIELAKQRATLSMPTFSYPLDGNFAKLNGDFKLDVGDVVLRNGAPFSTLLALLKDKPGEDSQGRIEPLTVSIRNGRVMYENFGLKLFRVQAPGQPAGTLTWKTQLDMSGDIDLAQKPPFAVGITTAIPASQAGNFSSDARRFFDSIGGIDSPLAQTLAIGLTMSGPLYDEQGKSKKLEQKITLPKVEDIAKDPGKLLEEGFKIFDKLKKK